MEDDIRRIKERLTIPDVLARYNHRPKGRPTRSGRQVRYLCPFHEEKTPSFTVDLDHGSDGLGLYHCFGCDAGGDVIRLVEQLEEVDTKKAVRLCREWAGIDSAGAVGPQEATRRAVVPQDATEALGPSISPTPKRSAQEFHEQIEDMSPAGLEYLAGRGISVDTAALGAVRWVGAPACKAFGLPETYADRLALPLRLAGQVVQVQARGLWPIGAAGKPRAALNLPEDFGPMDGLCGHLEEHGPVVLCEAPLDALSVLEAFPGISAVAVGGGSGLQVKAAAALAGRLVFLLPDNDAAGEAHRAKWRETLGAGVRDIHLPEGVKDANDLLRADQEALRALVAGAVGSRRRELFEEGQDYLASFGNRPQSFKTGLVALDADTALTGLLPDHLYVLMGDTGSGKTSLAHQLAEGIARGGRPALYVSLEMGRYVLWARTISRLSHEEREKAPQLPSVPYLTIITGSETVRQDVERLHERYRTEIAPRFAVLEGPANTSEIAARAQAIKDFAGTAPAIFVDYLQLLQPTDEEKRGRSDIRQQTDHAIAALRDLANELHTPVLAISSKGRGAYGRATLGRAKESSGIEYTADFVLSLDPANATDEESARAELMKQEVPMLLTVLKERDGRGLREIDLTFRRNQGRFTA